MASNFDSVAATTKDTGALYKAALKAAASTDGAEHQALRSRLVTQPVLDLLDSLADYEKPPKTLNIAGVLKQLMDNRTPMADETLNALASNDHFTSILPRQHLMILAMVPVRPASKEAVDLWRRHSQPKAPYKHVAMDSMANNGTEPAMALFEEVMASPAHTHDNKIMWMRDPVLRHRDNPVVLLMCERLLTKTLAVEIRPHLVSALFEHREEWYLSCDPPEPPMLLTTPRDAKLTLRRIGEHALANIQIEARTQAEIEGTLKVLPKPNNP
jgi:hypothetical protein